MYILIYSTYSVILDLDLVLDFRFYIQFIEKLIVGSQSYTVF